MSNTAIPQSAANDGLTEHLSSYGPNRIEPIAVSDESTVVAEFVAEPRTDTAYQSEAALEEAFIRRLEEQAYERLKITTEKDLIDNVRLQLEHHSVHSIVVPVG